MPDSVDPDAIPGPELIAVRMALGSRVPATTPRWTRRSPVTLASTR